MWNRTFKRRYSLISMQRHFFTHYFRWPATFNESKRVLKVEDTISTTMGTITFHLYQFLSLLWTGFRIEVNGKRRRPASSVSVLLWFIYAAVISIATLRPILDFLLREILRQLFSVWVNISAYFRPITFVKPKLKISDTFPIDQLLTLTSEDAKLISRLWLSGYYPML